MMSLDKFDFENVFLISPIVNMEKLIGDMMLWANVTEKELFEKKEIETAFAEKLSWDYLSYVRKNSVKWNKPTHILYGERDNLTPFETMEDFAKSLNATLTIMKNGEHWFHTEEQMNFVYDWITKITKGILKF